ncbi:MAG: quinoprotein dehydrogenase-associated putative ABC transporter substrate-binding protein [Gemmatimonadetes bacterium]|nr:MAG: quinoprotein dehydrogenase-associated putative ABC transporter substrate-binding protein [Gemmatimonadota bacterium]
MRPSSTRWLFITALAVLALRSPETSAAQATPPPRVLRVCADPNNLPFSNERQEGFENRIAELVARELKSELRYVWWAQRRGYIRNTLRAGLCDLFVGMPTGLDMVLVTRPYYRSTYAFVTKRGGPRIQSFDDARLKRLRIGVQIIGDDFANAPPAEALAHRGIVGNVRGYSVLGSYRDPNPPSRIVRAVSNGEVDVAVVWGPLAGYFARRSTVPLRVVPVSPEVDVPYLPFVFDIAMGVRRGETALRDSLDAVISRRQRDIDRILADYGVPRADTPATVGSLERGPERSTGSTEGTSATR